jgi:prolyl-tRNA synthetase
MYDIKFQAKDNTFKHPYYMSAGITTRLIGDLIVVHGDDKGIVMPFDISPIQIQILTLFADKDQRVLAKANEIKELLNQYRVNINSKDESFGFKANE